MQTEFLTLTSSQVSKYMVKVHDGQIFVEQVCFLSTWKIPSSLKRLQTLLVLWSTHPRTPSPPWCETSTGWFNPSGHFQHPLISAIHGAILKSFDVVRAMIRWFNIMYHKSWQVLNYPSTLWLEVLGRFYKIFYFLSFVRIFIVASLHRGVRSA